MRSHPPIVRHCRNVRAEEKVVPNDSFYDEGVMRTDIEHELSFVFTGFQRADHLECVRQCGGSDFAFESLLHCVEGRNDT